MNDSALATAVLAAWPALSAQPKLGAMTATRFADLAPPSERLLFTLQAILACMARDRELASPPGSLGSALHSDGQLPFTNRIGSASASAADGGPLLVSTWPASARSSDMSWSSSSMTSTGRISFSDDGSAPPPSLGPQDGGDGTSTLQRMLDAYREQLQPDDDDDAGAEPAAATAAGASSDGAAQQAAWEARFAAAADDDGPPAVHFDDDDQRRYAEQLRGLGLLHVLTPDDSETGCADADGEIRRQFADAIAGVDRPARRAPRGQLRRRALQHAVRRVAEALAAVSERRVRYRRGVTPHGALLVPDGFHLKQGALLHSHDSPKWRMRTASCGCVILHRLNLGSAFSRAAISL